MQNIDIDLIVRKAVFKDSLQSIVSQTQLLITVCETVGDKVIHPGRFQAKLSESLATKQVIGINSSSLIDPETTNKLLNNSELQREIAREFNAELILVGSVATVSLVLTIGVIVYRRKRAS